MKQFSYLWLIVILISCNNSQSTETSNQEKVNTLEFYGNTQGTTYAIIVNDPIEINRDEIELTLANFDIALSSYIPNSILTRLNEAGPGSFKYDDEFGYFNRCYLLSQEVYLKTSGAFDPTVYPLVDGWGFMKDIENVPDSTTVDSLRALLGFTNGYHFTFLFEESDDSIPKPKSEIFKKTPGAKLDFNAVAQGLAVDVIGELLEAKGAKNYFVEIGGEIRVKGKNGSGEFWRIGIDKPIENSNEGSRELQEIVQIENKSIATSGSYRKFYEKEGVKYSHTLDPKTGYPVTHTLLSATVVADNCGFADAMATAFMVMGPERSIEFIESNPGLKIEVYLIFNNDKGRMETYFTRGFQEMIIKD
ncbi:MAG: FAD:protein FMN transferase [Crocinitomicaceae bacterium]|nr:FAD:protein FMN transferase [Crocinitomicaceae bacterium]